MNARTPYIPIRIARDALSAALRADSARDTLEHVERAKTALRGVPARLRRILRDMADRCQLGGSL